MKIGVLVSRTGPAGLWGPSSEAAALLAAAELNAAGGVLGRGVELVISDPGWTEADAVHAVSTMVDLDRVDSVVGMHPSNVRRAIRTKLSGRIPYIYTPQYEGGERDQTTVTLGATDGCLMAPTLPWFVENRKARRFVLVANDYVWPQRATTTAKKIIARAGGAVVGEALVPFAGDYTGTLDVIRRIRPDVVVLFLLGEELVRFNRSFAAAGLSSSILRYALGFDENVLYGIGADGSENLFGASTFVATPRDGTTARFLERYHELFGENAPPVSVFGHSSYEGVHLTAALARAAGSDRPAALSAYLAGATRRLRIRDLLPPRIAAAPLPTCFYEAIGLDLSPIPIH